MTSNTAPVRIAILDDYQNVALKLADWSILGERARIEVFSDHVADRERVIERLAPFDVLCVMRERTPLPRAVIERLPHLKLIVSTGPRNASIDAEAAQERGVAIRNTRGGVVAPIELTWGLILAAVRDVAGESASVRAGGWQRSVGDEVRGKTLGVIGLGNIGGEVARIGQAFGMNVIAWSARSIEEKAKSLGVRVVGKDELFAEADILTIHLVLVEATRGLVGARELKLMKPTAYLINTARGPIVDEKALIEALTARSIAGAALDVFETEPLPLDHPFRLLDNVLATPHIGYVSRSQYERYFRDTVAAIVDWLAERESKA